MKEIYFITENKNKFLEAKAIIPELEQLDLDIPEIQELDPKKIIEEKLKEAIKRKKGQFIVEDTSLYIKGLNRLPGPLIKWFLKSLECRGIYELTTKQGDNNAEAVTVIGYYNGKEEKFFKGSIKGKIVYPKSESKFGWDPIFQPEGYNVSFNDMPKEEKNKISMRAQAFKKLKAHFDKSK
ncbi:non-canonical purine NTP pyrophosphatase [Candidatus Pacearchaeota archaeon]|nr:non-canonical purine NTP pyrophosphatase [Candidatus Pacearchaeota archaeon]